MGSGVILSRFVKYGRGAILGGLDEKIYIREGLACPLDVVPMQFPMPPKPGHLPLGISPGVLNQGMGGRVQVPFAGNTGVHVPISYGLHRRQISGVSAIEQRFYFCFKCILHHP